jgi:RimJ/RimL family protein N-acetyltransferase
MNVVNMPVLETPRLRLTWPSPAQIDGYHQAIVGTEIFDTLFWDGPSNPRDLHDFWTDKASHDPEDLTLSLDVAAIERASDRYIGGVSLRPVERDRSILDIGFAFAVDSHGKGYGTEAVGAMVDEAFRNRGAQRIFGNAFVGNHASRNVMEKLGFLYEGTLRRGVYKRGTWLDQWMLAITRPDWEARRR